MRVVRAFAPVEPIIVDRHKVIQILVNLLQNARDACESNPPNNRSVTVRIGPAGPSRIQFQIEDNGVGIPPENLTRIFSQGFTTKKEGHGFGLHASALAAKELGGSLTAFSAGPGLGACFTLELPGHAPQSND